MSALAALTATDRQRLATACHEMALATRTRSPAVSADWARLDAALLAGSPLRGVEWDQAAAAAGLVAEQWGEDTETGAEWSALEARAAAVGDELEAA